MQKQVEEVSKRVIQLKAVSVFELKLDRSLVTECATDPQRAALCKIVIDLIHHIGSTAVMGCAGKGAIDLMVLYSPGCLTLAKRVLDELGFQRQTTRDPFPEDRPM